MQIIFASSTLASSLGVPAFGDGIATFYTNEELRLIYDIMPTGNIGMITLAPWEGAVFQFEGDGDFAVAETALGRLIYSFTGPGSSLRVATLLGDGSLSESRLVTLGENAIYNVTEMSAYSVSAGDFAAIAQWRSTGFSIYEIGADGNLAFMNTIADTNKSYVQDVSDTMMVTVGGQDYLITASAGENGLTVFQTMPDGSLEFHDALGMNDGLPVNGLTAISTVEAWGATYLLVGATLTSSVSAVRINEMGVLFLEDHTVDNMHTKFRSIAALDTFEANGRTFVVAAGNDAGITILELLPGGEMTVSATFTADAYTTLGTITGIEVTVIGDTAHIYVLQATRTEIMEFTVSLENLGAPIFATGGATSGTNADDLIFGSDGNDTLTGGRGEDIIIDGDGLDELIGNGQSDTFVLVDDDYQDKIIGFQAHLDKLDLSDWGRLYSYEDLEIIPIPGGCEIRFGDESLLIYTSNGKTLTEENLNESHFIF